MVSLFGTWVGVGVPSKSSEAFCVPLLLLLLLLLLLYCPTATPPLLMTQESGCIAKNGLNTQTQRLLLFALHLVFACTPLLSRLLSRLSM